MVPLDRRRNFLFFDPMEVYVCLSQAIRDMACQKQSMARMHSTESCGKNLVYKCIVNNSCTSAKHDQAVCRELVIKQAAACVLCTPTRVLCSESISSTRGIVGSIGN